MSMRKSKVWLLLLAVLLLSAACGKKQETKEPEAVAAQEEEKEEEEEEEEEAAPEEETADKYQKGLVTESGWESEYLELCYTAPEGMHMSTEEELNSMMGIGEELLSDDFSELQLKYAEMISVYEMMSTDDTGAVNVIVTSEKVLGGLDAETYADNVRKQLESISVADYVISEEKETAVVGGKEFVKLTCTADYSGVSMHQDYYIRAFGDRVAAITVTYIDQTAELAGKALDGFTG